MGNYCFNIQCMQKKMFLCSMFLSELTFEKFADFAAFWHESLKQSDKVGRLPEL